MTPPFARLCSHAAAAAALALSVAAPAHAIVTTTVSGNTTTYLENFNGGSSFSNAGSTWFNATGSDDYVWLSVLGAASTSYSFTVPAGGAVTLDFYYAGPWSGGNGTVQLVGPPQPLGDTPGSWVDFLFANPGGSSGHDVHYSNSISGLAAGTYTLTFAKAAGLNASLKIDDVSIAVTAVPEPAAFAMLLAGLGIIGAAVHRRRAR
ncbi:MAG: PEP-CTERM sorting domain-containing protein [Aquabacterium sp.]|nr:PEP-CTERM sorting domain-containing protein [Aquabacterium sp.]